MSASPPRPLEPGDVVDIKPTRQHEVRRLFQFAANAQFRVLEIAKRTKYTFAMVRVAQKPGDELGVWLWKKQLHRVASKKIAPEWQAKKAA